MKRAGVVPFLLITPAITVVANVWIVDQYRVPELKFWLVTGWAPFRMLEFTLGMAIGWLLASPERHRALAVVRHPFVLIAIVALGFAAHTFGGLLTGDPTTGYGQALAFPLSTLGLALLALPLLVKPPSRIDVTLPLRALATVGVMSYAILIVNDAMRLVASQIRVENPPDAVWWTFLIAAYVPLSILIAWPVAKMLGLMPAGAPKARPAPVATLQEQRLRSLRSVPELT
jgi:hypothetical protein